jgi:hypothetical protein
MRVENPSPEAEALVRLTFYDDAGNRTGEAVEAPLDLPTFSDWRESLVVLPCDEKLRGTKARTSIRLSGFQGRVYIRDVRLY